MKKLTAWLVSLVLLAAAIPVCFAGVTTEKTTVELEDLNIKLDVPEGMYVLTGETPVDSGDWLLAGYEDSLEKIKEFEEDDSGNVIAMELVAEDKSMNIAISRRYSDQTRNYYNLNEVSDKEFDELLKSFLPTEETPGVTMQAEKYDHSQVPFFKLNVQGKVNEKQVWEICYGTIINGFSISIDMYSYQEFTEEQEALLQKLVDSVQVTKFYEKPTQEQLMLQAFLVLLPIIAIILLIVVVIVIGRINNKRRERRRNEMANRLVIYRREQAQKAQEGERHVVAQTLFENDTFCSDVAIKKFCQFHYFRKNLLRNGFYILLGLLSVVLAVIYDENWLLRLILFGLGAYMIVQPFYAMDKMTKTEVGVYQKARTRDAHYTFRAEDYRVSGIQSPMLYPYFQILGAYETAEYIYLYYTDERAYLIDKNGFKNDDIQGFRDLLKKNLGKSCHIQ